MTFAEKLNNAWRKNDSMVCVGLDPDLKKLPAVLKDEKYPIFAFNKALIDATCHAVCAYKPQAAFYAGQQAEDQLMMTMEYLRETCPEIPVILDVKRGDIGSTASKLEDINTSVMPITLLFVIGFMVVVFSMSAGDVDNSLMKICSFVPFTSPMAMFTRIAMSTVPWYEIAISVVILIASVIAVGVISAKIYRIGVLLYGTPPKLGAIIKAIRKA